MTSYKVLNEYPIVSTEKKDDSDGSGKMIQVIIPTDESPRADVRFGYKGPSGKFINNPPTYNPSEEVEQEVLEKAANAFAKARLYRVAIERLQEAGVPDERIPGVLDLIEEESNIEEVVGLATS
jgi:hypothetical protein